MRWTKKRKRTLESAIDDVFLFCELAEPSSKNQLTKGVGISCTPQHFKEAESFLYEPGESDEIIQISNSVEGIFMNCHPTDVPQFDASCCLFNEDENGDPWITLARFRQESVRLARGYKIKSPYIGSLWECFIDIKTGFYHGRKRIMNRMKSQWTEVGTVSEFEYFQAKAGDKGQGLIGHEDQQPEWTNDMCQVLLGIAFTRDVQWRVVVHGQRGMSLSFPTNASGAMAAFKQRDKDPGKNRRTALRNWVKEHYRKRSSDDTDAEVKVRQHLRGRTPFKWLGLDCELVVSPWDERKNERLKQQQENKTLVFKT